MKIAIDVMGGDHGPLATIQGAIEALKENKQLTIVLVGNKEKIPTELLSKHLNRIEVIDAKDVITNEDEPTKAIRKKESSMIKAIHLVKKNEVDAMVSAGNTGAFMTAGLLIGGRLEGVSRPCLAPVLPTVTKEGMLLLDAGANIDPKPEHLFQYAVMGSVYAEKVMKKTNPRIGLLNVGSEEKKGNDLLKKTHELLKNSPLNFIGNVEARDVLLGDCDVLVSDGISGNVLLKSLEGMANVMFSLLKTEFTRNPARKMGALLLKSGLQDIKSNMDYKEYGGALLLGLSKPLIKAHGSSDARAFKNAILQASRCVEGNILDEIKKGIEPVQK